MVQPGGCDKGDNAGEGGGDTSSVPARSLAGEGLGLTATSWGKSPSRGARGWESVREAREPPRTLPQPAAPRARPSGAITPAPPPLPSAGKQPEGVALPPGRARWWWRRGCVRTLPGGPGSSRLSRESAETAPLIAAVSAGWGPIAAADPAPPAAISGTQEPSPRSSESLRSAGKRGAPSFEPGGFPGLAAALPGSAREPARELRHFPPSARPLPAAARLMAAGAPLLRADP